MVLHVNDTREMRVKPATATVLMKRDRTTTVVDGCGRGGEVVYDGDSGGGGKGCTSRHRHGDPVHYLSSLL